jgi:PIN domain nuclease of toxin-antitoxin system
LIVRAPLLLDTNAAIWIMHQDRISAASIAALQEAEEAGQTIRISPITAWEIGMLVSKRRFSLNVSPSRWIELLLALPGFALAEMPPEVLIASSFLPGGPPADPAARILIATAREYGYRLITRDRALLAYAADGHLAAIEC